MNYSELIDETYNYVDDRKVTKSQVKDVVDSLVAAVGEHVAENHDSVKIADLGTFSYSVRAARDARNPKTGETIKVPAKGVITFKPAKAMKDKLDEHFKHQKD